MGRALVIVTRLVGGIGLGLALGYLLLVIAAFSPQGGPVATFLVGAGDEEPRFGFALVLIPYALLLVHMWLRVRVGAILLERDEVALATEFCSRAIAPSLTRARAEALANRIVLMRVAMRSADYNRVAELANEAKLPRRISTSVVAFHRWELEAALRRENLVEARDIVERTWPFAVRGNDAAAFCACAGELAVRNGDQTAWEDWRERAEFARSGTERLDIASAFAALKFGGSTDVPAELLAGPLQWLRDVPGAEGEIVAARARLLARDGENGHMADALTHVGERCDARSIHLLDRLRDEFPQAPADPPPTETA